MKNSYRLARVAGSATSAEPFSCCCILLALWFFVGLWQTEAASALTHGSQWCAYTCALLFTQTVKREDALLALALPLIMLMILFHRNGRFRGQARWFGLLIVSSVLAFFLSFKMHLLATSQNEQELLCRFPLTAARLLGFIWSSSACSLTALKT
jgi:hypothetical protein